MGKESGYNNWLERRGEGHGLEVERTVGEGCVGGLELAESDSNVAGSALC